MIVSEVVDGTLADGNPKFVEITNTGSAPYTFAAGGLIVQSNGSADRVVDVDLGGVTILPGQSFVIAATANDGQAAFESTYGFAADLYADAFLGDGNDRFLLTDTDDGSHILDIFGEINTNGTGRPWEYTDSYAYRHALAATPVGAVFDQSDWFLAGVNALETGDDAAEAILLQTHTTPGSHAFVPEGTPLVRVELYDPAVPELTLSSEAAAPARLQARPGLVRKRLQRVQQGDLPIRRSVHGATSPAYARPARGFLHRDQ